MNKIKSIFFVMAILGSLSAFAQEKTDSFTVYGNCGMCKKRIEKAAMIDGVAKAEWNKDTKMITVTFDSEKVSNDQIQQRIAEVGHDTDLFLAKDKVYNKLPGCCLYERKKEQQHN